MKPIPHWTYVGDGLAKKLVKVHVQFNPSCGLVLGPDWRQNYNVVWRYVRKHRPPRRAAALAYYDYLIDSEKDEGDWRDLTVLVGLHGGVFFVVEQERRTGQTLRELLRKRDRDDVPEPPPAGNEDEQDDWWGFNTSEDE